MRNLALFIASVIFLFSSCRDSTEGINLPSPKKLTYISDSLPLSTDEKYDKILGALVGSAIGDAMGASTEMWHRKDIQLKYGYINALTPAIREQSPEGTWDHNLNAGATTDDTRWKFLMVKYFSSFGKNKNPSNFSQFISEYYGNLVEQLAKDKIKSNPDLLDTQIEKVDWIKEWARVAIAHQKNHKDYQDALHRFYGGEMSCAGQLYTPMFGLATNTPEEAYNLAYQHALFDVGYAKDISALVSAMTNMAMRTKNIDSILSTVNFVDPMGYQNSRLVGRISLATADTSIKNILSLKEGVYNSLSMEEKQLYKIPNGFKGSQEEWIMQEKAYQLLEKDQKAIAFHAGEIWQILITALKFSEGDFEKTMQFIVNYGRDNDTVAAVAGMILGAKDGYTNLPKELKEEVLKVNRDQLGIDLEVLAKEMIADQ